MISDMCLAPEKRTCGEFLDADRLTRNGAQKCPGIANLETRPCRILLRKGGILTFSDPAQPLEAPGQELLTDAELADHGLIALGIIFLEVVEQAAALADQHEKSAARAVVFLVRLEVLRQLSNAFAEQGNLNFRTAGVARMRTVLGNEGFLLLSG
jgi:hypothetical protein